MRTVTRWAVLATTLSAQREQSVGQTRASRAGGWKFVNSHQPMQSRAAPAGGEPSSTPQDWENSGLERISSMPPTRLLEEYPVNLFRFQFKLKGYPAFTHNFSPASAGTSCTCRRRAELNPTGLREQWPGGDIQHATPSGCWRYIQPTHAVPYTS